MIPFSFYFQIFIYGAIVGCLFSAGIQFGTWVYYLFKK